MPSLDNQPGTGSPGPVLAVEELKVHYKVRAVRPRRPHGILRAVDDVSFSINASETLGLVGESGCGKSSVGRAIVRLIVPTAGRIVLEGEDLASLTTRELKERRRRLQIVFQDPSSSLNPRMTVSELLSEPLEIAGMPRAAIVARLKTLLDVVSLSQHHLSRYPHEFSGGQKQRIGIARALALEPKVLICDEPVSALDVSVQAQIVNLLKDIQEQHRLSYLFIAHDLGVVRQISHRVAVMYLGRIVEMGLKQQVYAHPKHPYTHTLLSAAPRVRRPGSSPIDRQILRGELPNPLNPPAGCRFRTRCPQAQTLCAEQEPALRDLGNGRLAACHFAEAG
jgi:peptide/nickel transport system ATP-binding protein/oligopeptide transport system ATP-binding protein